MKKPTKVFSVQKEAYMVTLKLYLLWDVEYIAKEGLSQDENGGFKEAHLSLTLFVSNIIFVKFEYKIPTLG